MDPWTLKKGYPVVNITRTSPTQFIVRQQRFMTNSEEDINNESYLWPISLSYFSHNVSGNHLMKPNTSYDTINVNYLPLQTVILWIGLGFKRDVKIIWDWEWIEQFD